MHVTFAGARENGIDEDVVEVNGGKNPQSVLFFFISYLLLHLFVLV